MKLREAEKCERCKKETRDYSYVHGKGNICNSCLPHFFLVLCA